MTNIEFITGSKVAGLSDNNLFDYVLNRVLNDNIVILEKEMDYQTQMEFIAHGLEQSKSETSSGVQFKPFFVTTEVSGLIRNKRQEVQFNLIAPGSSKISESGDGHYCVETSDGEVIKAAV